MNQLSEDVALVVQTQKQILAFNQYIKSLPLKVSDLQQALHKFSTAKTMREVQSLLLSLRLEEVKQTLLMQHNVKLAGQLLQNIFAKVHELNLSKMVFSEVSKNFSQIQNSLKQQATYNETVVLKKLHAVKTAIGDMAVQALQSLQDATSVKKSHSVSPTKTVSVDAMPKWKKILHKNWDHLKSLLVIRHTNNLPNIVSQQDLDLLSHAFSRLFSKTKLAIVNQSQIMFIRNIYEIKHLSKEYLRDSARFQKIYAQLVSLQNIQLGSNYENVIMYLNNMQDLLSAPVEISNQIAENKQEAKK
ncbi:MAG: hypothetical protein COB50_01550 [Thiotrichales bacterium]|nr:MAG: hypothetical protein COB50_01550 [Thiotrichales bacterium]